MYKPTFEGKGHDGYITRAYPVHHWTLHFQMANKTHWLPLSAGQNLDSSRSPDIPVDNHFDCAN